MRLWPSTFTPALFFLLCITPVHADFQAAREQFARLDGKQQAAVTLALIATGDFDGLVDFGFTRRLYEAIGRFERREGRRVDGRLDAEELQRLIDSAEDFLTPLGNRYYAHPSGHSRLLVPRQLFDREEQLPDGLLFTRADQRLSLHYVAVPNAEKTFRSLYASMTEGSSGREVSYSRLFGDHFVVTGTFNGRKFYSWFNRYSEASVGFTVSWSGTWDSTGRKVSSLLANSFLTD